MNTAKQLNTCLICGHRLPANDGFTCENPRLSRHRSCSKQRLLLALRDRADTLGLTSVGLVLRRLAEVQSRISQALGELGFEQFQTAELEGYLHLFLSSSDLKVRVVFSHHIQPEAIYRETLMTPGQLQQQKTRLLLRMRHQTPPQSGSLRTGLPERLLTDWMILADWLKQTEEHWNGRKKEEIAREVLASERVQFKILSCTGMDLELARPFVPHSWKLEPIARQILSVEEPEPAGQRASTRNEPAEVA